jgi:hypothetical protein
MASPFKTNAPWPVKSSPSCRMVADQPYDSAKSQLQLQVTWFARTLQSGSRKAVAGRFGRAGSRASRRARRSWRQHSARGRTAEVKERSIRCRLSPCLSGSVKQTRVTRRSSGRKSGSASTSPGWRVLTRTPSQYRRRRRRRGHRLDCGQRVNVSTCPFAEPPLTRTLKLVASLLKPPLLLLVKSIAPVFSASVIPRPLDTVPASGSLLPSGCC